jgi:hypothetical protein
LLHLCVSQSACLLGRGDNQIASLELLSIALGISTFEQKLRGRNVVVHSDNTTAEYGVRKGRAR